MTEIRMYEEHDKIVITSETNVPHDKLFDIAAEADIVEEWNDGGYTYRRGSLSKFMSLLEKEFNKQ